MSIHVARELNPMDFHLLTGSIFYITYFVNVIVEDSLKSLKRWSQFNKKAEKSKSNDVKVYSNQICKQEMFHYSMNNSFYKS